MINNDWLNNRISYSPAVSPHWPGVGKYIGHVNDFQISEIRDPNNRPFYSRQPWQHKRVYQDELDFFNNNERNK